MRFVFKSILLVGFSFAADAVAMIALDRNQDGRVDYLAVNVGDNLDEKVDSNFDGKFDYWILIRPSSQVVFRIIGNRLVLVSASYPRGSGLTNLVTHPKTRRLHISWVLLQDVRESFESADDCDSKSESLLPLHAALSSFRSELQDESCSKFRGTLLREVTKEVDAMFNEDPNPPSKSGCLRTATESFDSSGLAFARLTSGFKHTINPDNHSKLISCEIAANQSDVAQSQLRPLKLIIKFSNDESLRSNSSEEVAVHELIHMALGKTCEFNLVASGECKTTQSRERLVNRVVQQFKSCRAGIPVQPIIGNLPTSVELESAVEDSSRPVAPSIEKAASAVPIVNTAQMHELTFVRPTDNWAPAPARVTQVTQQMAKPVVEYAERVWAQIKPTVTNEIAMLPRASAGEGRANRQASSGTNVSKRDLDADTSIVDIKSGQSGVTGVVGGTPAPEKRSVERDVRKISQGNSQSGGLDADDAGDVGGETRTGAAKGTQSRRSRNVSQARAGNSAGAGAPVTIASSAGQEMGEEPGSGPTAQSKSRTSRGPAAVPRNVLSETERRIITSLESRKVNTISGRELVSQLVQNPQLDQTLKRKGISIVDNSGGRWGADYKKATHKYLVRGETITDMSD